MKIEEILGMIFEAILRFLVVVFGPYGTVLIEDYGHEK
jgi:hypothetical protein